MMHMKIEQKKKTMRTVVLTRDDLSGSIHSNLWEGICDDLNLSPCCKYGDYPETIELFVVKAIDSDKGE